MIVDHYYYTLYCTALHYENKYDVSNVRKGNEGGKIILIYLLAKIEIMPVMKRKRKYG